MNSPAASLVVPEPSALAAQLGLSLAATENQAVLFLVDASGSMSSAAIRLAVQKAVEFKTAVSLAGGATAVYLWTCDTVLRGEPIKVEDLSVDQYARAVEKDARGGTAIEACINQALSSTLFESQNVRALVYCSDLYANPVPQPAMLNAHPDIKAVFLCDPETDAKAVQGFASATRWAETYVIQAGEGQEANALEGPETANTRRPKMA